VTQDRKVTNRDRLESALRGSRVDCVPWVADLGWWYESRSVHGTLPESCRGLSLPEVHRSVGAMISTGVSDFYEVRWSTVEVSSLENGTEECTRYRTPVGEVEETFARTGSSESSFPVRHLVKRQEDFRVVRYLLESREIRATEDVVESLQERYGDEGLAVPVLPRTPWQRIALELLGLEGACLALHDVPQEVERLVACIADSDDEIYRIAAGLPAGLVCFGDNIDAAITTPELFRTITAPYYRRRTAQLRERGKLCLCHMDGNLRALLHLIADTGLDGVEGIAPEPMGDFSLRELRDAVEGKVAVWGGVPASILCDGYAYGYVEEYVNGILRAVAPGDRFVLGIGDMLPANGDIGKIRLISDLVERSG
jgi:uroporphyrinogen-III decarboxylase